MLTFMISLFSPQIKEEAVSQGHGVEDGAFPGSWYCGTSQGKTST
jgi:hypothetical protein